jgi:hypothetical protein
VQVGRFKVTPATWLAMGYGAGMTPPAPASKPLSLTLGELDGLREVGRGDMQGLLSRALTNRLMALGLVDHKPAGFELSREGRLQLDDRA